MRVGWGWGSWLVLDTGKGGFKEKSLETTEPDYNVYIWLGPFLSSFRYKKAHRRDQY